MSAVLDNIGHQSINGGFVPFQNLRKMGAGEQQRPGQAGSRIVIHRNCNDLLEFILCTALLKRAVADV